MARYKITKDVKSITIRVAFMIVREPMRFLNKPMTEKLSPWKIRRCETLVALWELKQMLEKDWFIERMELARMKLEQHNMMVRLEGKAETKEESE